MSSLYRPVEDYLLHRPPALLLDRVEDIADNTIVCSATPRADSAFSDGTLVPGWVGVEFMAQTVGVLAGFRALTQNLPVRIGFLVGCRKYESFVSAFTVNETIFIRAQELLNNPDGVVAMDCTLYSAQNVILAKAHLLVYQPGNIDTYLEMLADDASSTPS